MAKRTPSNTPGIKRSRRRRWFRMFAPGVIIAPVMTKRALSETKGARAARDYRARRALKIKTGRTKKADPEKIFPLPLRDSLESVLVADPRFKPPPDGATRHEYRKAVGETAALIPKDWAEKKINRHA